MIKYHNLKETLCNVCGYYKRIQQPICVAVLISTSCHEGCVIFVDKAPR